MSKLVAKKIVVENEQSSQLSTFIATLGVSTNIDLYQYNSYIYVRMGPILPLLSIDKKWITKNAESPLHYIIIKKEVYINKYGLTKLLAESKQPAAFKLQDYLYDLLYQVETKGVAYRDEIESRDKLLELYKTTNDSNQLIVDEAIESVNTLRCDLAIITDENEKLKNTITMLEEDNESITNDLEMYKSIANKLAKHVRVNTKVATDVAYDDNLDIDDEEEVDTVTSMQIMRDAVDAKKKITSRVVSKTSGKYVSKTESKTTNKPSKDVNALRKYYLLRSRDEYENYKYVWSITDQEQTGDLLNQSERFLNNPEFPCTYTDIVYREIYITQELMRVGVLFLSLFDGCYTESVVCQMLNI